MKNISILIFLFLISCGGSDDTPEIPEVKIEPPSASKLIFPNNNSECVEGDIISNTKVSIQFSWELSLNTSSYELKLKNLKTNEITSYQTNHTTYNIKLDRGIPYSWFVISKSNKTDIIAESLIWKFYSIGYNIPNYAPFPAEIISPVSGMEFNFSLESVNLEWLGSDIDDNQLSYDVLMDTINPPINTIANDISENNFNIQIEDSNTYYWRIISYDTNGNSSISEVSKFIFTKEVVQSSEKSIQSFNINFNDTVYEGIINQEQQTIELTLGNFDYKKLVPAISFSEEATISPKNLTEQNFLDNLYYTVTAEDGTEKIYDIIIKSGQHEILSFEVHYDDQRLIGVIDSDNSLIRINLGSYDYSNVPATLEISKRASITPLNNSYQNFNEKLYYTVTSEIGTSKTFEVIAPIELVYVNTFFGQKSCDFSIETIDEEFKVYPGSDLNFQALNVQNLNDVIISLEKEDVSYELNIEYFQYNNYTSNGFSNSSNYIKTTIPYEVPSGKYNFKIYDQFKEAIYNHKIEIINDDTTMKITDINKTNFTRNDTIKLKGKNLSPNFIIKSNGNSYVFKENMSEVTINEDKTEVQVRISSNVYGNLKTWSSSNQKPLVMNKLIDGYPYLLNSNTIYFNID